MDYILTLIDHPSYLHARGTGRNDPSNARRFLREAFDACMSRGVGKLLLEKGFTGPSLGWAEIFRIVTERSAEGTMLRKIAYVEAPRDESPERSRFAENVAINRGVNVRLFTSVEEAERWLLEP